MHPGFFFLTFHCIFFSRRLRFLSCGNNLQGFCVLYTHHGSVHHDRDYY